jgi:hypothetical protein
MLDHESESGLLNSVAGVELSEVIQSCMDLLFTLAGVVAHNFSEPLMVQSLDSGDTLGWIMGEHLHDQVLGRWLDLVPDASIDLKLTLFDGLDNLQIRRAVEWWISTEEHVEDDTDGPNIAKFVIRASKDLWCDIVCSSVDAL